MINKTIMTYGDNSEITKEHNKRHCADALIVFIIELTNNILIIWDLIKGPNSLIITIIIVPSDGETNLNKPSGK